MTTFAERWPETARQIREVQAIQQACFNGLDVVTQARVRYFTERGLTLGLAITVVESGARPWIPFVPGKRLAVEPLPPVKPNRGRKLTRRQRKARRP